MIVVSEDQPSKKATEANLERTQVVQVDDPPPLYTASDSQIATSSTQSPSRNLPDIKPSNFVYLSRANSSVKGTWVIDPSLSIPSSFLPPLVSGETEETRKNIFLESKNGVVDGEIFILPTSTDSLSAMLHRQRVLVRGSSRNGSVTTKIHDVSSYSVGETRLPIQISCYSSNGSIHIYLPRSFQGPLSVQTHNGSLRFSEPVKQLLTPFSEMNGVQRSFLGHLDSSKWENGAEWVGDELAAESKNGNVKIYFDDEGDTPFRAKSQSFFGRIFNF